jgi:hypothetical protein
MLPRALESATCVQRFDDSLNSAIRITYRISLRSSSLREPRYPLLRVVCCLICIIHQPTIQFDKVVPPCWQGGHQPPPIPHVFRMAPRPINANDPSAGSPTETLLRLLLPLVDQIYKSSTALRPFLTMSTASRWFTGTTNR